MGITDELREWAESNTLRAGMSLRTARDQALAIADRIDAEHEAKVSYWQGACYEDGYKEGLKNHEDATRELDEKSVLLPMDADGEVIHIGDVMDTEHFGTVEVEGFVHGAVAFYNYSGQPAYICTAPANTCHHHHHEPTVEDVLREFGDWYAHTKGGCDEDGIIAEYAARLLLRGDA